MGDFVLLSMLNWLCLLSLVLVMDTKTLLAGYNFHKGMNKYVLELGLNNMMIAY